MNYNFLVEQEVNNEENLNDHLLIGKCRVLGRILLNWFDFTIIFLLIVTSFIRCT